MKLNNILYTKLFSSKSEFFFLAQNPVKLWVEIFPKVVENICEHLIVLYVILIGDVYVGLQTVGTDTVDLREKRQKDMDPMLST